MKTDNNSQNFSGEMKVEADPFLNQAQTGFFLWILDQYGNLVTVNHAVLQKLGYLRDDLVGKHFSALEMFTDCELKEVFRNSYPPQFPYKAESRIKTKDGHLMSVNLMGEKIALFGDSYILLSALVSMPVELSGLSADKDSSQFLNEINSNKDNIFSVIAHDLRSPFNTILGYCELLNSSIINSELNKSIMYTRIIKDATEQTLSFLVRLLDWGRLQNDQPPYNPVYFEAELPVKQITRLCGFQADSKKIILTSIIEADLKVYGDVNMIRTVLVNLISNSIKFCNPGGKITVKSYSVIDGVEFDVEDNGIGIKNEDLQKLFNSEKLNSTNGTCMEHGTGLGLAICKSYIAIHKGRLWADSKPGIGSTFKFFLPSQNLV